jgi:hypothetical protein
VLPLDVYLENELEIVQKATGLVEDLTETVGYKLLRDDPESKVVVNFHGVRIPLFLLARLPSGVVPLYSMLHSPFLPSRRFQ